MQKLLYGIGAFIGLLIVIGLFLPRTGRFVVQADIDANPATVFALLNDMRRTELWSQAFKLDPNTRTRYSGPARGAGATVSWDGAVIGSGTQTIIESRPYEYLETVLNAGESGESRTWFELAGGNGQTSLHWGFEHDYGFNLVGRYMSLMLTGIIRRDYERSLANLKELAESLPRTDFSDLQVERIRVEPQQIAYLSTSSAPEATAMSEALGAAYFEILNFMDANGLHLAGAPLSISRSFSGAELHFDAAIPVRGVTEQTPRNSHGVRIGLTHGGNVLRVRHQGSYRKLNESHRKIAAYLAALGIERNGDSWESYVNDPTQVEEDKLLTYLYYPVRDEP